MTVNYSFLVISWSDEHNRAPQRRRSYRDDGNFSSDGFFRVIMGRVESGRVRSIGRVIRKVTVMYNLPVNRAQRRRVTETMSTIVLFCISLGR